MKNNYLLFIPPEPKSVLYLVDESDATNDCSYGHICPISICTGTRRKLSG